jgi:S1-C subfamily serine protease
VLEVGQAASTAGVRVGDIILAVDLGEVRTSADFLREMNARNPFASVNLRLRRENVTFVLLTLGVNDYAVPTPEP